MQMDRVQNATPEQRIKEFRKSMDGNQSERNEGFTGTMCKCLSQLSSSKVDIKVFDGNVLEFNYFMSIFEKMVESEVVDPRAKLTRLINYTKGSAKKLVKHCIQKRSKICYHNAKYLLMKRCIDPRKILLAYQLEI